MGFPERKWYFKALAADSSMIWALFLIENSYVMEGNNEQSRQWLIKNYQNRDKMSYADQIFASWAYAFSFESPDEQIKYLIQLSEIDDQDPDFRYLLGLTYNLIKQYDKAISELKKSLEISRRWGKDYLEGNGSYFLLGRAYTKTGQYKKAKKLYKEAEKYIPGTWLNTGLAVMAFAEKDTIEANKYIEKYISAKKETNLSSEADMAEGLGGIYFQANILDKAEEYYRNALSLEPDNLGRIKVLTNFLIENDRSLNDVSRLMDRAMELATNNNDYYNI